MGSDMVKYILLIDDDQVLARQWQLALVAHGFEVGICTSVENGFLACEQRWPDGVVLDAFFRDKDGRPTGSGGLLFCTKLSIYAYDNQLEPPLIIGVTGSRPGKHFPVDVFGLVSKKLMPVRLEKPFSSDMLIEAFENGLK